MDDEERVESRLGFVKLATRASLGTNIIQLSFAPQCPPSYRVKQCPMFQSPEGKANISTNIPAKIEQIKEYPTDFLIHLSRPPTTAEASATLESVNQIRGDLTVLETEISRLKNHLSLLVDIQGLMENQVNAQLSILSPFRRLPDEVLSEIFQHCLPPNDAITPVSCFHAPFLVQGVCRRWRDVTRMTPTLWTSISLQLSASRGTVEASMAEQWIRRAGSLPLRINLGYYYDRALYHSPQKLLPNIALDMALAQSRRWQALRLALSSFRGPLNSLQDVQIFDPLNSQFSNPGDLSQIGCLDFIHAQRLRALGLGAGIRIDCLRITWHFLRKLVLNNGISNQGNQEH